MTLAVKLQEMFGCAEGPVLLNGDLPVTLELLSQLAARCNAPAICGDSGLGAIAMSAGKCVAATRSIPGRITDDRCTNRQNQKAR